MSFLKMIDFFAPTAGVFALAMTATLSLADELTQPPKGIDHIVFASSDLQRGMDEIEALLGVRPVAGGHHPEYGTRNALLSLGPGVYLEIVARDPDIPSPKRGALVNISADDDSRLVTWVFRTEDIAQTAMAAQREALGLGPVLSGSRKKPDGSEISWKFTDPYAMPMDGAIPFLIDWGNTSHPSAATPYGGRLVELIIEHPDADLVSHALSVLGAEVKVVDSDEFRLTATIETQNGLITVR